MSSWSLKGAVRVRSICAEHVGQGGRMGVPGIVATMRANPAHSDSLKYRRRLAMAAFAML
jgi:hypothetical protein